MSRPGLFALALFLCTSACTVAPPAELPDVLADWPDAGRDAGYDAAWPELDAYRPPRPDAGPDRRCAMEEVCGNGLDDDCDGVVDQRCDCEVGLTEACFRGDPTRRGLGRCRDGAMRCEGTEFGTWTACEGDVLEEPEVCDDARVDEDCDGVANEGCECEAGTTLPCGTDEGECRAGVQRCENGTLTACEGALGPRPEVCDGRDEDCDGRVDEGLSRRCGMDRGICRAGVARCVAGAWGACEGEVTATVEVCNNRDDDCDGTIDERVSRTCGTDTGACIAGTQTCAAGRFGACEGAIGPSAETCNAVDDDCDGRIDEDLVRVCGTDVGACIAGLATCRAGSWGTCDGEVGPSPERCEGRVDEDCDGAIDEGCACTTGATRGCGTDVGLCVAGTQTCDAAGAWGACVGGVDPRTETCDGTDDDCDGLTDEGCLCVTGAIRSCGTSVGECRTGLETCDVAGRWGVCLGGVSPTPEICNGRDDDCDGLTDEGDVCPRSPPVVTCPAPASTAVGATLPLGASAFDPDGGFATITWNVTVAPTGSVAAPTPTSGPSVTFTPDRAGSYTLLVCAIDDEGQMACCTTTIAATAPCALPAAPTVSSCGTSWDRRPIVEFTPVPAGQFYVLYLDGVPYGTTSMTGQNYFRPAAPIAPGGPPPGTTHAITVRACRTSEPTCCATSTPVIVSMVEACTTPVPPSPSNIVLSEYITRGGTGELGESFEITNLSHCPVSLAGNHFSYCNGTCAPTAYRWMNFTAEDVIPPRGVYVAIRDRAGASCTFPFLGPDDPGVFGLRVSRLAMEGSMIGSTGWFNNDGGPASQLRVATGPWSSPTSGTTLARVAPYLTHPASLTCSSYGFDAIDACGDVTGGAEPTTVLTPNQLGRLWHPCDAVVSPVPASCR